MSDEEIYNKACDRLETANGFKRMSHREIIVELEKEIDVYREKIAHLENIVYAMKEKTTSLEQTIGKMYGECIKIQPSEKLEAVQESSAAEIIKALSDNGYNTITVNCYKDIESEVE